MELPIKCKKRIIQLYPINAKKIIMNLENLIDNIVSKYKLENIKILDIMSYNIIIDAYSKEYKNVIVKIGILRNTISREIEFYNIYSGNSNVCKVYDFNIGMNYLVLKKALPALKLDNIQNFDRKLKIYKKIFRSLNKEESFSNILPLYKDIFLKSVTNCKEKFLQEYIGKAKNFLIEIENLHLTKYVLHGDIHHWNIVLDDSKWKLIDPARICGGKSI